MNKQYKKILVGVLSVALVVACTALVIEEFRMLVH